MQEYTSSSTGRSRELGQELRRVREVAGYQGNELAARLGWSPSKVSRLETGKSRATEVEITTYLVFCGVVGDELTRLLDLGREADPGYRLASHHEKLPDELRSLVVEENTAAAITDYESIFIPGLAQTEDYAHALIRDGSPLSDKGIEARVQARLDRQGVFKRMDPTRCTFLVHENALRTVVGGPAVMHEQLLHLLFLDTRPQCTIRIVPASAGNRGLAPHGFRIMDYADHPPVAYVETLTASLFLEQRPDIALYRARLNRIDRVALDEGHSREVLALLASEYDRMGEGDHEHA